MLATEHNVSFSNVAEFLQMAATQAYAADHDGPEVYSPETSDHDEEEESDLETLRARTTCGLVRGPSMLAERPPAITSKRPSAWNLKVGSSSPATLSRTSSSSSSRDDETSSTPPPGSTGSTDGTEANLFEDASDGEDLEVRLRQVEEEFGVWPGGGERFIRRLPGGVYRSVIVKGVIALTNKRVVMLAYLPSEAPATSLRSGAVTFHTKSALTRKTRRWMELRSDSLTWFRKSHQTHKPTCSRALSELKSLKPLDMTRPTIVSLRCIDDLIMEMECDTEESASAWHSEIAAALFRYRTTTNAIRIMIPLQNISEMQVDDFANIAQIVKLSLDKSSPTLEEDVVEADEGEDRDPRSVSLCYINRHKTFFKALERATQIEKEYASKASDNVTPKVVLDVGGSRKYGRNPGETSTSQDGADDLDLAQRFKKVFGLTSAASNFYITRCQLVGKYPVFGTIALSNRSFCFWRRTYLASDVKLRIPLSEVGEVKKVRAFWYHVYGLAFQVRGYPDVRLDFHSKSDRDRTIEMLETRRDQAKEKLQRYSDEAAEEKGLAKRSTGLSEKISENFTVPIMEVPELLRHKKVIMDDSATTTKKYESLHFVCLTIGSRGDVQPYIALAKRLRQDGHTVTIASHPEYRPWVESFGIQYREVGGDPGALMKLSVEHSMLSPSFFKEALSGFRIWLDDLFEESWQACQGADVLIQSPSTFAGIHIAEALKIPFLQAFTMPWTKTSAYPQAFSPSADLGPSYNLMTYSLFDTVIWKAMSGQVNRWRRRTLGLRSTNLELMRPSLSPFIYNFSTAVCPKPNDWRDHTSVSGYWFLDQSDKTFQPSPELVTFIAKAKSDGVPLIYVGFGSITVPNASATTKAVYEAVRKSGVRAIVVKGWSDRTSSKSTDDIQVPEEVFAMNSIPHDWLFPQIEAACHHGGAGTTGASLRFGVPTLIHPFFGDQHFWASRVTKLGVGLKVDSLSVSDLSNAFKKATSDRLMKEKAAQVGEKIRADDGVGKAVEFIYEYIPMAKKMSEERAERVSNRRQKSPSKFSGIRTPMITESPAELALNPHSNVVEDVVVSQPILRCQTHSGSTTSSSNDTTLVVTPPSGRCSPNWSKRRRSGCKRSSTLIDFSSRLAKVLPYATTPSSPPLVQD